MPTLVLHPETFIFEDDDLFLLYHSLTHRYLECQHSDFLDGLFHGLCSLHSLYQASINANDYSTNQKIINRIVELGLGELYANEEKVLLSYVPILNLNYDFQELKKLQSSNEDNYLLRFLHEITIFISGQIKRDSILSQIPFPLYGESPSLTVDQISAFLFKTRYCNVKRINIMVSSSEDLKVTKALIEKTQRKHSVFVYIKMGTIPPKEITQFEKEMPDISIKLIGFIDDYASELNAYCHEILVKDERSFSQLNKYQKTSINRIIPLYNGDMAFFKEYLSICREDILQVDKNDIYIHQTLNPHFFGKLFVFPDGTISDSHFGNQIGVISEMIHTIIRREIDIKGKWFFTRDKTTCRNCRFKYLCPSPSTYEIFINEFKICFLSIKEGSGL